MTEIKEILACTCSNCGDTYNLSEACKDFSPLEYAEFIYTPKTCLRCGKEYMPYENIHKMDDFVLEAIQTVKM